MYKWLKFLQTRKTEILVFLTVTSEIQSLAEATNSTIFSKHLGKSSTDAEIANSAAAIFCSNVRGCTGKYRTHVT